MFAQLRNYRRKAADVSIKFAKRFEKLSNFAGMF